MENTQQNNTDPITSKEAVKQSNDGHIDQDFKNAMSHSGSENLITPETTEDKVAAQVIKTGTASTAEGKGGDSTKQVKPHDEEETAHAGSGGKWMATTDFPGNEKDRNNDVDESMSDGSGGAFSETENAADDDAGRGLDGK